MRSCTADCGLRYQQLTYLFSELGFHPGEKTSALTLTPLKPAEPARRLMVDLQMAGTYKFIRDIQTSLHKGLRVIQVDIPYPKPAQAQLYEQFYGCSVRFAASKGRFWMHNVHLQSHLPSGDPTAKALYRQQCDQLLQKQKQEQTSSNLAEQVRAHLWYSTVKPNWEPHIRLSILAIPGW